MILIKRVVGRIGFQFLLIGLILAFFASCDVSGDVFSPSEKNQLFSAELRLLSSQTLSTPENTAQPLPGSIILDGATLKPGSSFNLFCKALSEDSPLSAASLSLSSGTGLVAQLLFALQDQSLAPALASLGVATGYVERLQGEALPVLLPADIAAGAYSLKIEFFDAQESLFVKSYSIFILDTEPRIDSIQVCPASVSPGSVAVLQASVSADQSLDPYLVWKFGPSLLGAGRLADGADQLLWKTPDSSGVYSLSLFVYPFPPNGDSPYAFPASLSSTASVITQKPKADPIDSFADQRGFYSLFHFDGNFKDVGYRPEASRISLPNPKRALILGLGYGIPLDVGAGLSFDEYLLPIREGRLEALSIMARFLLPQRESGSLFRSESGLPGFNVELGVDADGQYYLSLSNREDRVISLSGIVSDGRLHDLAVSIIPQGSGYYLGWFLDNKSMGGEFLEIDLPLPSSFGRSFLGGSIPVVFDEFGIYSKQSPSLATGAWDGAFPALKRSQYRDGLLLALGLDSPRLDPSLAAQGKVYWDSGFLNMGPEASLAFTLPQKPEGAYRLELNLAQEAKQKFIFEIIQEDTIVASIDSDGQVRSAQGELGRIDLGSNNKLELSFFFAEGSCSLLSGAQSIKLFSLGKKTPELRLRCLDGKEGLVLDSILLRRLSELEVANIQGKTPILEAGAGKAQNLALLLP